MMEYLRISNEAALPDISRLKPYKSIIVAEMTLSPEQQATVSEWLVKTGCLYMMAWGIGCDQWESAVDIANLGEFSSGEIPKEAFVMTTCHNSEPLEEVFWFAKNSAFHPEVELQNTLILHIGDLDKGTQFQEMHKKA